MKIQRYLHSFSLRYALRHREDCDVFWYIDRARTDGFDGVNISANGPGYRDLGGTTAGHFASVRDCLRDHGLGLELDTSDTRPENLTAMIEVCRATGADRLRVYTRYRGTEEELVSRSIADLAGVADRAAAAGVVVVLENHEDFTGAAIAAILAAVDHPSIRALFDYGNSQMLGEDPLVALDAMLPFVTTVHFKDHLLLTVRGRPVVQGVTVGEGRLPLEVLSRRLHGAGLRRFCLENVWGYHASPVAGAESVLGFDQGSEADFVDGDLLDPVSAVRAERESYRRATARFHAVMDRIDDREPAAAG